MFLQDRKAPLYTDIDLSLQLHPLTGDISTKENVEAIRRSMLHLFSMNKFDIPFDATRYTGLRSMLFESSSHLSEASVKTRLEHAIKIMEPRVEVSSINTSFDDDWTLRISVVYLIKSINIEDTFDYTFERVR